MKFNSKIYSSFIIAKLAVLSVALLSLISTTQRFYKMNTFAEMLRLFANQPIDSISLYGERFEEIKKYLPPSGIIGYVDDKKDGAYSQTQYFLAPLVIDKSTDRDLIIGNFRDSEAARRFTADSNLILQKDFDNGVVLFTREVK